MMTVDLRSLTLVERKDGFDYAQPAPYGSKGTSTPYETLPPFGLMGRPRGPSDGLGANGLVLMHGPKGYVIATTDPRYQAQLPDLGDGGAGLYANAEIGGSVNSPFVGLYGKGGEKDEGTFRIEVVTASGATSIEVSPSTGDVTIQHAAGTKAIVKADGVYLGDDAGAVDLVRYPELATAWAALQTAMSNLGQSIPALVGANTTKVKGT